MIDSLLRRLRGDARPSEIWSVEWSRDSSRSDGEGQWFAGPDAEGEARQFADELHIDAATGYVRVARRG